jgi:hypothetical protein
MLNYIVALSNGFLISALLTSFATAMALFLLGMLHFVNKEKIPMWLVVMLSILFLLCVLFLTFFPSYDQWQILLKGVEHANR